MVVPELIKFRNLVKESGAKAFARKVQEEMQTLTSHAAKLRDELEEFQREHGGYVKSEQEQRAEVERLCTEAEQYGIKAHVIKAQRTAALNAISQEFNELDKRYQTIQQGIRDTQGKLAEAQEKLLKGGSFVTIPGLDGIHQVDDAIDALIDVAKCYMNDDYPTLSLRDRRYHLSMICGQARYLAEKFPDRRATIQRGVTEPMLGFNKLRRVMYTRALDFQLSQTADQWSEFLRGRMTAYSAGGDMDEPRTDTMQEQLPMATVVQTETAHQDPTAALAELLLAVDEEEPNMQDVLRLLAKLQAKPYSLKQTDERLIAILQGSSDLLAPEKEWASLWRKVKQAEDAEGADSEEVVDVPASFRKAKVLALGVVFSEGAIARLKKRLQIDVLDDEIVRDSTMRNICDRLNNGSYTWAIRGPLCSHHADAAFRSTKTPVLTVMGFGVNSLVERFKTWGPVINAK